MDIVQQANGRSGCVCYNPVLLMKTEIKIAFDESINKWVRFYTTDRIDYDFETGQQLEPIMCDYHVVGTYDTKEEAENL